MKNNSQNETKRTTAPVMIPVDKLQAFDGHPYKVLDDDSMNELIDSVQDSGILQPLTVRPLEGTEDKYEIISGHRRFHAAQKAGLNEVPAFIRPVSRYEAAIMLVDSNLHREHILPSEKAYAYKMKMEAISHQGKTCGQIGHKSREIISDTESGRQVQRYIRLTNLIPELLDMMDEGKIAFSVGVELSFLDDKLQYDVLNACEESDCTPSYAQAVRMHKAYSSGTLTSDNVKDIMSEEKPNQRTVIRIPAERIRAVIPKSYDAKQQEDYIVKAVNHYHRHLQRQRDPR